MKVEKIVGWLTGNAGTGNVFELSHNGGYLLAMIWQDGKFHYLSQQDLNKQVSQGTAGVQASAMRSQYLSNVPENADGSITVENPAGWQRLYQAPAGGNGGSSEGEEATETLEIPFKFDGKLTIDVSQLSALLNLID